jgi:hypothetical protein
MLFFVTSVLRFRDLLSMENFARYLMIGGVVLFLIGGGAYLASKFGIPLGRLPGDIRIEGENGSFYFPLTTSILVSVLLTILLNIISRFMQK